MSSLITMILNGELVAVDYSYSPGYDATWEEPGCDEEWEILAVYWTTNVDITIPLADNNLPPLVIQQHPITVDLLPTLSEETVEQLLEDIATTLKDRNDDW